jgi:hypothetical protein
MILKADRYRITDVSRNQTKIITKSGDKFWDKAFKNKKVDLYSFNQSK